MPQLSVIIPTHDRADILEKCLQHLEAQTIADQIEVIVINDIQDDKFDVLSAKSDWHISVYFETVERCLQGVARNIGVQKAQSPICMFIGDDIFLNPRACELHLNAHRNSATPIAVLGDTDWDPSVGITKTMRWLMKSGWQFGYTKIARFADDFIPKTMQHTFSYTSHISLPLDTAKRLPFREDITLYGWEDIEWGMRLRKEGIPLYFEAKAKALHHHKIDLPDSLKRMEVIGTSAAFVGSVIEEFDRLPKGWKRLAYEIFSRFPTMAGKHRKAFLQGIAKAKRSITS